MTDPDVEMRALVAALDSAREHVLGIVDGLDEDALNRALLPSGWSCLAIVQHLTLDVERFWLEGVVEGQRETLNALSAIGDKSWDVAESKNSETIFAEYRRVSHRANDLLQFKSADASPAYWPPEWPPDWRLNTVREVILHVIVETATHAGHLDTARELIDGRQWLVLTNRDPQ